MDAHHSVMHDPFVGVADDFSFFDLSVKIQIREGNMLLDNFSNTWKSERPQKDSAGPSVLFFRSKRPCLGNVMEQRGSNDQLSVYRNVFMKIIDNRQTNTHNLAGVINNIRQHRISDHHLFTFFFMGNSVCDNYFHIIIQ